MCCFFALWLWVASFFEPVAYTEQNSSNVGVVTEKVFI